MEPRPIEPQDIRVGMRVRVEWSFYDVDHTADYTVDNIVDGKPYSIGGVTMLGVGPDATWTLLADAPTPDRPAGSHWRDPETGAEYVIDIDGDALLVAGDRHYSLYLIGRADDDLARLTPLPVFDPAVLWPPAKLDDDWCAMPDANSGNVCSRPAGHGGWVHAAYEAYVDRQELGPLLAIWGDPR